MSGTDTKLNISGIAASIATSGADFLYESYKYQPITNLLSKKDLVKISKINEELISLTLRAILQHDEVDFKFLFSENGQICNLDEWLRRELSVMNDSLTFDTRQLSDDGPTLSFDESTLSSNRSTLSSDESTLSSDESTSSSVMTVDQNIDCESYTKTLNHKKSGDLFATEYQKNININPISLGSNQRRMSF